MTTTGLDCETAGSGAAPAGPSAETPDHLGGALRQREQEGSSPAVIAAIRSALDHARVTDDRDAQMHATLALGESLLDASADADSLRESIRHHQAAERLFRAAGQPTAAAYCLVNTAVAYLSLGAGPSSLKPKIAVQCLQAALADLDPVEHAELWQSAMLNLGNALQQCPPEADGGNIADAVGVYLRLLELRTGAHASARARVLANLGTALARLGRFDDATARLDEARNAFADDADAVAGVDATLAEIDTARHRALNPHAAKTGDAR